MAAQATAINCGEIILPVTPPLVLAATSKVSETPIWCAVVACSEPNRAAREVSNRHIHSVQEVLAEVQQEAQRLARAQRRQGL